MYYLGLLEDCGHGIALQVTDAPSHLKARGCKVFVADVLVSRGSPVLTTHVPQPLLQPGRVLQREPGTEQLAVKSISYKKKKTASYAGNQSIRSENAIR